MTQGQPKKCETPNCDEPPRKATLLGTGLLQSYGYLPAYVYVCSCGWKRVEPLVQP